MPSNTMKKNKPNQNEDQALMIAAGERVGQVATLHRGILRGEVRIKSCRTSYGRIEYLVQTVDDPKNSMAWVTESSLTFAPAQTK